MEFHNRRKFQRINFDGLANLNFANDNYDCCRIKNISLTGMCVAGSFNNLKARKCFVKIFHSEKTGNNCLIASASIVWKSEEAIGMKFTGMTLENYELLRATLAEKAEQPMLFLSEIPNTYPYEVSHPN